MNTIFAYIFAGIGLYLFDTKFEHPFRTPKESAVYLAKPCNEPYDKSRTKLQTLPTVTDTVWINYKDKPRDGYWAVLVEIEQ